MKLGNILPLIFVFLCLFWSWVLYWPIWYLNLIKSHHVSAILDCSYVLLSLDVTQELSDTFMEEVITWIWPVIFLYYNLMLPIIAEERILRDSYWVGSSQKSVQKKMCMNTNAGHDVAMDNRLRTPALILYYIDNIWHYGSGHFVDSY